MYGWNPGDGDVPTWLSGFFWTNEQVPYNAYYEDNYYRVAYIDQGNVKYTVMNKKDTARVRPVRKSPVNQ